MKSPTVLNYEVRPCKFVERRMLLSVLSRIIPLFQQEYQYIGFGGLSFTDFKMFHRELHINQMFSIEYGYPKEKLEFNKPYSCIQIHPGRSIDELSKIDLTKPSIIWLDYDGCLNSDIFEDLEIIFNRIPHGSIYLISCNRQMRNGDNQEYTKSELKEVFGPLVPWDIEDKCCVDSKAPYTIRRMLELDCINTIKDRNRMLEHRLKFEPIFNITYEEYRGARMFTYGGVVLNESFNEKLLHFEEFDFVGTPDPYKIEIPNLTYREAMALNQAVNIEDQETLLISKKILKEEDIRKYKKCYKYLPNFYDVRI